MIKKYGLSLKIKTLWILVALLFFNQILNNVDAGKARPVLIGAIIVLFILRKIFRPVIIINDNEIKIYRSFFIIFGGSFHKYQWDKIEKIEFIESKFFGIPKRSIKLFFKENSPFTKLSYGLLFVKNTECLFGNLKELKLFQVSKGTNETKSHTRDWYILIITATVLITGVFSLMFYAFFIAR